MWTQHQVSRKLVIIINCMLNRMKKTRKNRRFNNIYKRINTETARNLNGRRWCAGPLSRARRIYWTGPLLWDTRALSHSMWAVLLWQILLVRRRLFIGRVPFSIARSSSSSSSRDKRHAARRSGSNRAGTRAVHAPRAQTHNIIYIIPKKQTNEQSVWTTLAVARCFYRNRPFFLNSCPRTLRCSIFSFRSARDVQR